MIRKAKLEDVYKINQLRKELIECHIQNQPKYFACKFDDEFENQIVKAIQDEKSIVMVYEEDNKILGYINAEIFNFEERGISKERKCIWICEICVDKQARRKKIATQLFEFINQIAKDKNIESIELNVWDFNESAISFYEKMGFKSYRRVMKHETQF